MAVFPLREVGASLSIVVIVLLSQAKDLGSVFAALSCFGGVVAK